MKVLAVSKSRAAPDSDTVSDLKFELNLAVEMILIAFGSETVALDFLIGEKKRAVLKQDAVLDRRVWLGSIIDARWIVVQKGVAGSSLNVFLSLDAVVGLHPWES